MKIKYKLLCMMMCFFLLSIGCTKIDNDIVLDKEILTIVEGQSYKLILVSGDVQGLEWISSNLSIASVEKGLVTAISPGIATITAKSSENIDTCIITVTEDTSPKIDISTKVLTLKAGEKHQLYAQPVRVEGDITWTSSKNNVAIVDEEGNITAYSAGKVIISASIGSVSGTCAITVKNPVDNLDSIDFYINVEEGREIRVLQLSDTQIIDSSQMRNINRLGESSIEAWAPEKMYENCFKYILEGIERTNPDFIFIAGDVIYGEFDDEGTSLEALIEFMDSFKIPWGLVFGNHENESYKGVAWQVEQLYNSQYCLFKRGNITGNSNYSVGILQGVKLARIIYLIDSNGCKKAANPDEVRGLAGIAQDQVQWLNYVGDSVKKALGKSVPSIATWHIVSYEFSEALDQKYPYPDIRKNTTSFEIGNSFDAKDNDFGSMKEGFNGLFNTPGLYEALKLCGVDGVFIGHNHEINTSIFYKDIRWTFGLKTGTYDSYTMGKVGSTSIVFNDSVREILVKHIYFGQVD